MAVATASWSLAGCNANGSAPVSPAVQSAQTGSTAQSSTRGGVTEFRAAVRSKIKHVFVLIQENHTFDNYFGLYPGMNGQTVDNLGTAIAHKLDCQPDPVAGGCQRPFLITTNTTSPNYVADAPDITGGFNGRADQEAAINHGKMNGFLTDLEAGVPQLGPTPSPAQIQAHNEAIGIESLYDCDTIPYLWYYAKNFTLFDHYFQAETGDSTPSNIQLFSGQIGQTEAARGLGTLTQPEDGGYSDGVPISNDDNPPNSQLPFAITSYTGDDAQFQSYATMPVMLNPMMDRQAVKNNVVGYVKEDMTQQGKSGRMSVPWAWYEEGLYTANAGFSAHHTAPLYFDYMNNPNTAFSNKSTLRDNTLGNGLISDIKSGSLPSTGVFWVKGGNENQYNLAPADPIFTHNSSGSVYYVGDDDHPGSGSSDHQVAQAYLAEVINAIANSKYWKDSVIIVTWDDSGGMFDHLPPPEFGKTCPQDKTGPEQGYACGDGVRLPALVISPFSKTGVVVHDFADHGSVSKFIEGVFGLPTFASLPDERLGTKDGLAPADADSSTSDLTDALDPNKLYGWTPPNPRSMAIIPMPGVPAKMNCNTLGITPIPAPAPLPKGYETAGWYLAQQLEGNSVYKQLPPPKDDGD